jgi:predicted dehydrogenase
MFHMNKSRRTFLKATGTLLAGSALLPHELRAAFQRVAPSDRLRIGVIGANGMGWSNVSAFLKVPGVELAAICDVDSRVISRRLGDVAKLNLPAPVTMADYRKMLDMKDLDAVIIGTPDHWHCLQTVHACQAGKDVYVEKPVGNSIAECRVMEAAAKKYQRVVQSGQWQRSSAHFQEAVEFVHSGKLGNIRTVKSWAYMGWMKPVAIQPDGTAPAEVDYRTWLGPATMRPFNANRFHFNFRWFWDYAGGLMTDWGVHMMDYALLGMQAGFPLEVMATGGKMAYPDDAAETPDTLTAVYRYDKFNLVWEQATGIDLGPYRLTHGTAFIGNNGTLVLNREGWEVIPEKDKMEAVPMQQRKDNPLEKHVLNFVEAVKARRPDTLKAPIEAASLTAQVCQLGNMAYRTGGRLQWDAASGKCREKAANELMQPDYKNGYRLPVA